MAITVLDPQIHATTYRLKLCPFFLNTKIVIIFFVEFYYCIINQFVKTFVLFPFLTFYPTRGIFSIPCVKFTTLFCR